MKLLRILLISSFLIIVHFVAASCSDNTKPKTQSAAQDSSGKMLVISDIHFDPFYDPTLIKQLLKDSVQRWEEIFQSSTIRQVSPYSEDSNFPLFSSLLQNMQQTEASPDFILISGDLLSHDFNKTYKEYVKDTIGLQLFITKTIQFQVLMLGKYFPETVILPVLGNNDSFTGDYDIEPDSPFLNTFATAWAPLLRKNNRQKDAAFVSQFSKGGYYIYESPSNGNMKFIMLNTVFFAHQYKGTSQPAKDELRWLTTVMDSLTNVQQATDSQKIWIMYHIPPGFNVHDTLRENPTNRDATSVKDTCQVTSLWKDKYTTDFLTIIRKHSATIQAAFAGHTHMDDFRIIYNDNNKPVSFIHITPSVSPIRYNNPGFQYITYDNKSFTLTNAQTFYFNDSSSNGVVWRKEYDFNEKYKENVISALSLDNVKNKIQTDSSYRKAYTGYYPVSSQKSEQIAPHWRAYWCAIFNLYPEDFTQCCCDSMRPDHRSASRR